MPAIARPALVEAPVQKLPSLPTATQWPAPQPDANKAWNTWSLATAHYSNPKDASNTGNLRLFARTPDDRDPGFVRVDSFHDAVALAHTRATTLGPNDAATSTQAVLQRGKGFYVTPVFTELPQNENEPDPISLDYKEQTYRIDSAKQGVRELLALVDAKSWVNFSGQTP